MRSVLGKAFGQLPHCALLRVLGGVAQWGPPGRARRVQWLPGGFAEALSRVSVPVEGGGGRRCETEMAQEDELELDRDTGEPVAGGARLALLRTGVLFVEDQ